MELQCGVEGEINNKIRFCYNFEVIVVLSSFQKRYLLCAFLS